MKSTARNIDREALLFQILMRRDCAIASVRELRARGD